MLENKTIVIAGFSFLSLLFVTWWWKKQMNANGAITQVSWKKVGTVSELIFYPVKGGRGVSLNSAKCGPLGLIDFENAHLQLGDRQLIVYNKAQLTAVTAFTTSQIVLLEASADEDAKVRLSFPGRPDVYITLPPANTDKLVFLNRWWGERVGAIDCGDSVEQWLSEALLQQPSGLRLGYFSPIVPRRQVECGWLKFAKVYSRFCGDYLGAYSYMASYLLITEESVSDLARQVGTPVNSRRFRPNISVRGVDSPLPAYCEDTWDYLRLGESVVLRGFKPCTRCAYICIDPHNAQRDSDLELLTTLKRYRPLRTKAERDLSGDEPVFGLYAGLVTPGTVHVGDHVYVGSNTVL